MIGRIQRAIAISQLQSKRIRVRRFWAVELVLSSREIVRSQRSQRMYDASRSNRRAAVGAPSLATPAGSVR